MKIYLLENETAIAAAVGETFVALLQKKTDATLGLATGASPVKSYAYLVDADKKGRISFRNVKTFNLDEYCDIPAAHPNSYRAFMQENLFAHVDIPLQNIRFLDGNTQDTTAESVRYRQEIVKAGGIDLQLLGLGRNGHIGFNEPGERFPVESYKVALHPSTIAANAKYFAKGPVPKHAMTMGTGEILRAKKIVMIATGPEKAEAVRAMANAPITAACPATALRIHKNAAVFLDEAAARLLDPSSLLDLRETRKKTQGNLSLCP
jgi:glucosamine-6-phosphate deaminase